MPQVRIEVGDFLALPKLHHPGPVCSREISHLPSIEKAVDLDHLFTLFMLTEIQNQRPNNDDYHQAEY